jgi:hypothetical protein
LTLKPHIEDNIIIPAEFLVTLPDEIQTNLINKFKIVDSNQLKNKKDENAVEKTKTDVVSI